MANPWTPIGEMRHLITIQRLDITRTESGETTETAVSVCEQVHAKIEPLNTQERWKANLQQDTTAHRIRMLYQPGIVAKMQALWNDRVLNFTSVIDLLEMRRELEILATEATST